MNRPTKKKDREKEVIPHISKQDQPAGPMVFSCICDIVICQQIKEITKEEAWRRRSKRAGEIFKGVLLLLH